MPQHSDEKPADRARAHAAHARDILDLSVGNQPTEGHIADSLRALAHAELGRLEMAIDVAERGAAKDAQLKSLLDGAMEHARQMGYMPDADPGASPFPLT